MSNRVTPEMGTDTSGRVGTPNGSRKIASRQASESTGPKRKGLERQDSNLFKSTVKRGKPENMLGFADVVVTAIEMGNQRQEANSEPVPIEVPPAKTSLQCLTLNNPLRKFMITLTTNKWFDRFILMMILANCAFLVLDTGSASERLRSIIDVSETVFISVFTVEMIFKIIAMGFWGNPANYLSDPWNRLDFIVVILGYSSYMGFSNFTSIRTLRVLRPLRAIKNIPGMRIIISSLLMSLPHLADVLLLFVFLISVFGILGVQLYGGKLSQRCFDLETGAPVLDEAGMRVLCSMETGSGFQCPSSQFCARDTSNPNYDMTSFDNIIISWILIIQCISLEGWSDIMHAIDEVDSMTSRLYFIVLTWIGSYFVINLVTAVIFLRFLQMKNAEEVKKEAVAFAKLKDALQRALGVEGVRDAIEPLMEDNTDANVGSKSPTGAVVETLLKTETHHARGSLFGHHHDQAAYELAVAGVLKLNGGRQPDQRKGGAGRAPMTVEDMIKLADQLDALARGETTDVAQFRKHVLDIASKRPVASEQTAADVVGALKGTHHSKSERSSTPANDELAPLNKAINTKGGKCDEEETQPLLESTMPLCSDYAVLEEAPSVTVQAQDSGDGTLFIKQGPIGGMADQAEDQYAYNLGEPQFSENTVEFKYRQVPVESLTTFQRKYQLPVYRLIETKTFNNFIVFAILLNTLVLSIDYPDMKDSDVKVLDIMNMLLFTVFLVEATLKVFGLGPRLYCATWWNIFDGTVVFISLVEQIFFSGGALSVLRSFRLLRVLRLLNFSESMRTLMSAILMSINDLYYFCLVFVLFVFIYSILGMQLFAGTFMVEERAHFDNFPWATLTVFQLITGENWNEVMYTAAAENGSICSLYFISVLIIGNYMLLSLFLAIMLGHFDALEDTKQIEAAHQEELDKENPPEEMKKRAKASKKKPWYYCCSRGQNKVGVKEENAKDFDDGEDDENAVTPFNKEPSVSIKAQRLQTVLLSGGDTVLESGIKISRHAVKENKEVPQIRLRGKSLFVFSAHNKFRVKCARIATSHTFENAIVFFIVLGCVLMAIDTPGIDPDTHLVLDNIDFCLTIIFALEMILKIIALGFIGHSDAYLHDGWNVMDFFIVISSVMDIIFGDLKAFKSVRILRVLRSFRALRMLSHLQRLRLVVSALWATLKALVNVMLIASLFFIIFSILGVQFFKGKMWRCEDLQFHEPLYEVSQAECLARAAAGEAVQWAVSSRNFDHVGMAFLVLFEISTLEMWPSIMYEVIDTTGTPLDQGPKRDSNQAAAFFFVSFIVVGSLFVVNLFIGVVVDQYNKQYQKFTGVLELNEAQDYFLQSYKDMAYNPPQLKLVEPSAGCFCGTKWGLKFRQAMFRLSLNRSFELFIVVCICFNVLAMAINHDGESELLAAVLTRVNDVFSTVFLMELIIKVIGLGWKQYLMSRWNCFDAFIVAISIIVFGLSLTESSGGSSEGGGFSIDPSFFRIFRIFRVLRIFRLVRRFKGLNALIQTLVFSFPSLYNVGTMLFLLFFMYSVIGMSLFYFAPMGRYINKHANFKSFSVSLVTLFRLTSGESWNGMMHELMAQATSSFDRIFVIIYFVSFTFLSQFLLVNVFVAVVLKNFEEEVMSDPSNNNNPFSKDMIVMYGELWTDNFNQFSVDSSHLKDFLKKLPAPFALHHSYFRPGKYLGMLRRMDIPIYNNKVHCLDVCIAICSFKLFPDRDDLAHNIDGANEMLTATKIQVFRVYPELRKLRKYRWNVAECTAAQLFQRIWRAYRLKRLQRKPRKSLDITLASNKALQKCMAIFKTAAYRARKRARKLERLKAVMGSDLNTEDAAALLNTNKKLTKAKSGFAIPLIARKATRRISVSQSERDRNGMPGAKANGIQKHKKRYATAGGLTSGITSKLRRGSLKISDLRKPGTPGAPGPDRRGSSSVSQSQSNYEGSVSYSYAEGPTMRPQSRLRAAASTPIPLDIEQNGGGGANFPAEVPIVPEHPEPEHPEPETDPDNVKSQTSVSRKLPPLGLSPKEGQTVQDQEDSGQESGKEDYPTDPTP